ncbi:cytohesin-4 isoform X4 [Globicephala melas]|uniref:cytohesin-4 isoform X4 n=1 Tax=Globicephala melas TaxID=9731 RepID=UPI0038737308
MASEAASGGHPEAEGRDRRCVCSNRLLRDSRGEGIQYLTEHKLLTPDVQDIAQFLYKGEGLNKTAIGTYLGERDPINLQVLQAFVDCHEFANLNLVQALRQFLWSFRLPGEAQKIDRMMETFATRYCLCNPGVFQSTDTCYVLSFSIIMLNTSLHNPNVRDRPPFERFVSMNRGINDGSDLPEEQLRNLFDSIKSEPFSIPEDDGNDLTHTFFNPDREGWLLKLGGRVKTWKRRWFILTDSCLYYFEFTTDKEPRGIIPLENLSVQKVDDPKKPVVLPGALQPQLPRPEDKGLQDGRRWQGGRGQARVLPHLSLQRRGAGPVDQGHSVMGGRTGGEVSPVTFQKHLLLLEPCFLVCKEG